MRIVLAFTLILCLLHFSSELITLVHAMVKS